LYLGAQSTKLIATMLLMNICIVHGVSNKFVDELLSFLHKYLLPPDNCLPTNMYHAKSLTRKVGLNYKTIHACPNGCILFWGVYVDLATCPKCGQAQFKDVSQSNLPIKVLRHFPYIPHLKCMFRAPVISKLIV
jgi:hypothetical protein